MTKEQKFYKALQDVFIGAKVEGNSGFVNLMRIKSGYYSRIEKILQAEIEEKLKDHTRFREELFVKLYDFFHRYFTESGSIYFNSTPFHNNVYERVYTDDKDVILFWKTQMLYYVKTDRIFRSMPVEFEGLKFYFDASDVEHKKSNEKRSLVYEFKSVRNDGYIVFLVHYSERGNITKNDEILKEIRRNGLAVIEEQLEKAFHVFEKQSEVDYFINKNAREFLKEQFKLWLYQYTFDGDNVWTKERIDQLQILKDIAYKIIDFISQFEDELVKIWNKPKFVLNSNYVITLDKVFEKNAELVDKILRHEGIKEQIKEWKELGIVQNGFKPGNVFDKDLTGKSLKSEFAHLPIDTKYFKDLELDILGLFDDLDKALDGWLIKSENYQALNTILPKFKGKVQTIYIDPPFNLDSSDQFLYRTNYKDANWATILENRLKIAKGFLDRKTGGIFVRCDDNGNWIVRYLMSDIFGQPNFRNEIDIKRNQSLPKTGDVNLIEETENLFVYALGDEFIFMNQLIDREEPYWGDLGTRPSDKKDNPSRIIDGVEFKPPAYRRWSYSQENLNEMYKNKRLKIEDGKLKILIDKRRIGSNWTDIPGYSATPVWGFSTENSEKLLSRVINMSSEKSDFIIDFFLGSATATAVAHKLGRKWLGIEMGDHFYSFKDKKGILCGVIIRMKEVLAGKGNHEPYGISKEVNWQGGGFFKYYKLEQYEEALKNTKYSDGDIFTMPGETPYSSYVFMKDEKMLSALEIDYKNNKVKVDLSKLHSGIDLAETLSNLSGKWIKKIKQDSVKFEDGEVMNLKDIDYRLIKPLIWW